MTILAWSLFILLVIALLMLDLGVLNKDNHEISTGEALRNTGIWIGVGLAFDIVVFFAYQCDWFGLASNSFDHDIIAQGSHGWDAALKYVTGYLIEKALSLDNIFVMAMLFTYFKIPNKYQHEVLFWGILGALVFRGAMIILGAALVNKFAWVMYIFGGLLVVSSLKMLFGDDDEFDAEGNVIFKLFRKIYPISNELDGGKFFTRLANGAKAATPLLVVLIIIESTDILFAVDSIPAIFSVTTDPFIVYTSNVFAILGLRSLYFVLASFMEKFKYLKYSLVVLLLFIGAKMLLMDVVHISIGISLLAIVVILGVGVVVSVLAKGKE